MLVRELVEMLSAMDGEMEVCFADLYSRSEGWGEGCEDAVCAVDSVVVRDGMVVFESED